MYWMCFGTFFFVEAESAAPGAVAQSSLRPCSFIEKLPRRFDVLAGMLHRLHTNIRLPLYCTIIVYKSVLNTPSVFFNVVNKRVDEAPYSKIKMGQFINNEVQWTTSLQYTV